MTDIVERLRERAARKWTDEANRSASLFGEAADEIERLRAELATLRASTASVQADQRDDYDAACALLAQSNAERDALRALLLRIRSWDHMDSAGDGPFWKQQIDAAMAQQEDAP